MAITNANIAFTQIPGMQPSPMEPIQDETTDSAPKPKDLKQPVIFSDTKCIGRNKSGYGVKRYLCIQYPWNTIRNASLEIRILDPEAIKKPEFCKPMCFMTVYGSIPQISQYIYRKKIGQVDSVNDKEFPKELFHELDLPEPELILSTIDNLTGTRGSFFHSKLINPETKALETTLIFPNLKEWEIDNDRLVLELRGKLLEFDKTKREFSQPCDLRIWLLKDDYIVWQQDYKWPGNPEPEPAKKQANSKSESKEEDESPAEQAEAAEKDDSAEFE